MEKDKRVEAMFTEIEMHKHEAEKMKGAFNQKKIELHTQVSNCGHANKQLQELRQEVADQEQEIQCHLNMLKQELDDKNVECKMLTSDIDSKNEKCRILTSNIDKKEEDCRELKIEIDKKKEECRDLKSNIDEFRFSADSELSQCRRCHYFTTKEQECRKLRYKLNCITEESNCIREELYNLNRITKVNESNENVLVWFSLLFICYIFYCIYRLLFIINHNLI